MTDQQEALAWLYGEPLFEVPQDLYIPPQALEVFLEAFEGPLDLLLYLIRRQNFNVLDIPMVALTEQYLAYVQQIRAHDLALAGEYLLMAALLIEIKSRMLLPKPAVEETPEEDPRAELVRRLLEYEKIKVGANQLDTLPRRDRDFHVSQALAVITQEVQLPEVSPDDLQQAWQEILHRAKLNASHRVTQEPLSVREHMSHIIERLRDDDAISFTALFDGHVERGVAVVVVHFLALLELIRESVVTVDQEQAYAPIYLRLLAPVAAI